MLKEKKAIAWFMMIGLPKTRPATASTRARDSDRQRYRGVRSRRWPSPGYHRGHPGSSGPRCSASFLVEPRLPRRQLLECTSSSTDLEVGKDGSRACTGSRRTLRVPGGTMKLACPRPLRGPGRQRQHLRTAAIPPLVNYAWCRWSTRPAVGLLGTVRAGSDIGSCAGLDTQNCTSQDYRRCPATGTYLMA